MEKYREFLKAYVWDQWRTAETDQRQGLPRPEPQKPYSQDAQLIDLLAPQDFTVGDVPLLQTLASRRSHRQFTPEPLTLEELAFLLWSVQGVNEIRAGHQAATLRSVPSAGARHCFETYLLVRRVEGLEPGLYRYLPVEHKLCFLQALSEIAAKVDAAWKPKSFLGASAVNFVWTTIPYRMEWRYGIVSPKMIALDAGHVCQNLYLACAALGVGTCAVGDYDQDACDAIVEVDGEDEFVVYVAPVGRIKG
jgi:SagB-type dehydrogenase family enzyme